MSGYWQRLDAGDKATLEEKVNALYNVLNNVSREMSIGRVPRNRAELQKNIEDSEARVTIPLSIAFVKMAESGDIDEITASEHADMFLPWSENNTYNTGDLRTYTSESKSVDGETIIELKLYKCLQAHTSQASWTPDISTSLWKECVYSENGVPVWSQPISTVDAYMLNDEVINPDDHLVWVSDYNNNVWKPGEFGWHLKE